MVFVASQRPPTPPFLKKRHQQRQVAGDETKTGVSKSSTCQDKTPRLSEKEQIRSTAGATAGSSQQPSDFEQTGIGEEPYSGDDAKPPSPTPLTMRDIFGDSDSNESVEMRDEESSLNVNLG